MICLLSSFPAKKLIKIDLLGFLTVKQWVMTWILCNTPEVPYVLDDRTPTWTGFINYWMNDGRTSSKNCFWWSESRTGWSVGGHILMTKNFSHFFSPWSNEVHWNWRLLNTISRKYSWNWCGSWESFWKDEGERSKTKFRYCRTADDSIIVLITPSLVLRDQIMFTSEPLAEIPVQKIFPHDIWWLFDASLLRY